MYTLATGVNFCGLQKNPQKSQKLVPCKNLVPHGEHFQ